MPDKDRERLKKEDARLREAILSVTINWAHLENTMAHLLGATLLKSKRGLGEAIYFAVASAEARFSIVDSAVHWQWGGDQRGHDLLAEWARFFKTLGKARRSRNSVIHGNVIQYTRLGAGKDHIRLVPPTANYATAAEYATGQLPGMSPHDVEAIGINILHHGQRAHLFHGAAMCLLTKKTSALLEKLQQLEDHRQTSGGRRKDGQTPQES